MTRLWPISDFTKHVVYIILNLTNNQPLQIANKCYYLQYYNRNICKSIICVSILTYQKLCKILWLIKKKKKKIAKREMDDPPPPLAQNKHCSKWAFVFVRAQLIGDFGMSFYPVRIRPSDGIIFLLKPCVVLSHFHLVGNV